MEREHRYWVAKVKDVEKYLTSEQQTTLHMLMTKINVGRLRDDKPVLQTVCVDSDWPEYEIVWKMIEARVDGKASPASVPEWQALWDSVYKTLRGYRMAMMVDSDGDGYPLIDAMSPEHGTVASGIEECTYLADAIYNDLLAASPTPPVSEDRKDAERYRWLRKEWFREDEENSWFMQSESSFLESPDEFDAAIDAAMEGK